jgi:hypothetical protein
MQHLITAAAHASMGTGLHSPTAFLAGLLALAVIAAWRGLRRLSGRRRRAQQYQPQPHGQYGPHGYEFPDHRS